MEKENEELKNIICYGRTTESNQIPREKSSGNSVSVPECTAKLSKTENNIASDIKDSSNPETVLNEVLINS
jgi:hypothetical protein